MLAELAYGDTGLVVELPASATIVAPRHRRGAGDEAGALRSALRAPVAGAPLRDRLRPGQHVAISVCDVTRPQPRRLVVPALIEEMEGIVDLEDIVVLVATGTHRASTRAEHLEMFGAEVLDAVRVVDHDARDHQSMAWVGTFGNEVPVWLNRHWCAADVRITTGVVEPHFFAGFSGGPKMVAPGLAALETTLVLHDHARIADPRATFGVTVGNPVHDDVRAIARGSGIDFSLDLVLDRGHRIVEAFAGEWAPVHDRASRVARAVAMAPVLHRFDVVVTTGSGYPLDQNLYQAVKGIAAAHRILRPGGTIICAAECRDGFPDHGPFQQMLSSAASPAALLERLAAGTEHTPDQWQVQILARIQADARVVMHTSYLSDGELAAVHLEQTGAVGAAIETALERAGPGARLCVLPEGPRTIPYLAPGP